MQIYYFQADLTPHLSSTIAKLSLPEGLPYTVDQEFRCDAVVNDFFLSLAAPSTRGSATWRTYAEQLSMFFRFLASQGVSWNQASQQDLLHYYRLRRVGEGELKISARSWNVFVAACRRFYEWAARAEHISVVPFTYKQLQSGAIDAEPGQSVLSTNIHEKAFQKDLMFMTDQDFRERLLPEVTNTRHGIRNALIARLLMRSGLRASEAVGLKISKLPDPDNPRYAGRKTCPMEVIGKGQKLRTVRVPKTWLRDAYRYIEWDRDDAIQTWKRKHPRCNADLRGHKGFLFLTSAGTPITYSAVYDMLRTAGENVGFNFKAHPHMLRHSYAIYQLSAMIAALLQGEHKLGTSTAKAYRRMIQDPLRKLQKLMGHSSITSTFIYLDYVDDVDDMVDVTLDKESFDQEDGYEAVGAIDG